MARKLKVDYIVTIEPEDMPFEGNCSAIDPETDRQQEEWIRQQLNAGNELAWCWVRVVAKVDGFEGDASCGGCSYRDRDEMERSLLPDLRTEALDDLRRHLTETMTSAVLEARKRADTARRTLARLPKKVRV